VLPVEVVLEAAVVPVVVPVPVVVVPPDVLPCLCPTELPTVEAVVVVGVAVEVVPPVFGLKTAVADALAPPPDAYALTTIWPFSSVIFTKAFAVDCKPPEKLFADAFAVVEPSLLVTFAFALAPPPTWSPIRADALALVVPLPVVVVPLLVVAFVVLPTCCPTLLPV
jgi:hypothetical protein